MQQLSEASEGRGSDNYTFHLHPGPEFRVFAIGDQVFNNHSSAKLTGLAVVVRLSCSADEIRETQSAVHGTRKEGDWRPGRVQIRLHEGSFLIWASPAKLTKVLPANKSVFICGETDDFRELARTQPRQTDFVADLGCSAGMATRCLSKRAHRVVGIDISEKMVEEARKNVPGVQFEVADVLQDYAVLRALCRGVDVVFVDIGGVREASTVARLLLQLPSILQPKLVVVKSRYLLKQARAWLRDNRGGAGADGTVPDAEAWLQRVASTAPALAAPECSEAEMQQMQGISVCPGL